MASVLNLRAFYQGFAGFATIEAPCLHRPPASLDHVGHSRGSCVWHPTEIPAWHGTTILTVRKGGTVVIGGDGQVSIGQTIVKANAKKVRRLGKGDVIGGFAGATADAFTLFERLESQARAVSRPARCAPRSNSPRTGAPTAICAGSKP